MSGAPGTDGKTTYTWIAYSDNADGSGMYQIPNDSTKYIGIAVNRDTATESDDPAEYTWSLFRGIDAVLYSIEVTRGNTRITSLSCNADGSLKGINEFEGKFYRKIGDKKEICGFKFLIYGYKNDGSKAVIWLCTTVVSGFVNMPFVNDGWNEYDGILISCYEGFDRTNVICDIMIPKIIDGQAGSDGIQGLPGLTILRSEWHPGVEYRNDEAQADGIRYLSIALVKDRIAATGWRPYKCLQTHISDDDNKPGNTTYWEELAQNVPSIYTPLVIADNAKIDFLSGNEIRILDADNNVTAGVSGSGSGEKGIRFYAGSDNPQNAPFRVNEKGKVIARDGVFYGSIATPFIEITDDNYVEHIRPVPNTTGFSIHISRNLGFNYKIGDNLTIEPLAIVLPLDYENEGIELNILICRTFPSIIVILGIFNLDVQKEGNVATALFDLVRLKCIVIDKGNSNDSEDVKKQKIKWIYLSGGKFIVPNG